MIQLLHLALSVTVPALVPPPHCPGSQQPGASTEVQSRRGKVKGKTNQTSKEEVALEFAKIEVKTVQAKLKMLETRNKDLEFQNSILLERVFALEKVEKEAIYDKYFPKASEDHSTAKNTSEVYQCSYNCNHVRCCCSRTQCCQPQPRCQLPAAQPPAAQPPAAQPPLLTAETLGTILVSLNELKTDRCSLKNKLSSCETAALGSSQPAAGSSNASTDADAHHGEPTENISDSDDSVMTVNENCDELPSTESLN